MFSDAVYMKDVTLEVNSVVRYVLAYNYVTMSEKINHVSTQQSPCYLILSCRDLRFNPYIQKFIENRLE